MKYEKLIQEVIKNIGGEENVDSVTHCITRLRFVLKDDSKASVEACKKINGVVGCVNKGGQFQVIIGANVGDVYDELLASTKIKGEASSAPKKSEKKESLFNRFFDMISNIFMPVVGALAGAGMVKAILAVCTAFHWLSTTSTTYILLYEISDCVFYYLPFFLAFTSAKKFKCNPYIALIFAAMLLHPNFLNLKASLSAGDISAVTFLGLPVKMATYSTSVIPIILIVALQSYVERFVKKYTPDAIKIFFVPMVTILVVAPIGLIALGPLGTYVGSYLAMFFNFLDNTASWICPTILGCVFPLLVMTGMHYSIATLQVTQRATMGYGSIFTPASLSSNMSQAAAVFAVSVRTKNAQLKSLASSVALTALCGITEPALYGVTLKYKRTLYATMIGGACAGFWMGIQGVKSWSSGTSNIFSLPIYIGPDNSFVNAWIGVGIALTVSFIASFLLFKEPTIEEIDGETTNETTLNKKEEIKSPVEGGLIPLSEVDDEAFSTEAMGKGIAILPVSNELVSPVNGTVEVVFGTKHAIGLKSDDGTEVLIHIGLDTVKLDGKHFTTHVSQGDKVKVGDPLATVDFAALKEEGYDIITPIIVTNSKDYLDVIESNEDNTSKGAVILTVIK